MPVERIEVRTEALEADVLVQTAAADVGPERLFQRTGPDDVPQDFRSAFPADEAVDRLDEARALSGRPAEATVEDETAPGSKAGSDSRDRRSASSRSTRL